MTMILNRKDSEAKKLFTDRLYRWSVNAIEYIAETNITK